MANQEVLLRVEHLSQYFGSNKAVDDVSFDIYKGEVFGLVGESGCGKTTTGRSIIKLYNITGGDVTFKGQRICAGKLTYRQAMDKAKADYEAAQARAKAEMKALDEKLKNELKDKLKDKTASPETKNEIAALKAKMKVELADKKAKMAAELADEKAKMAAEIANQKAKMKAAMFDHKNCDKEFAKKQAAALKEKYEPLLAAATGEQAEALKQEYKNELRKAKKTKLVTQIQMIFQDPIASLDPRMTVKEIIAEGLVIQGERNKKVIEEKVYEMLELVGLVREHASRYPHEFSGGQRQRIGVARSVIMNPDLIIADEPVSALDVSVQAQVINLLNDLRDKFGLTILFIAHDLSVVKYFSDRIGVMYYGKMVELASSEELFRNPLHPYTKSLLSAIPLPDPVYEKTRQRIVYNPLAAHDYSQQEPTFQEVAPGHFVRCNDAELEAYRAMLK